MPQEGLPAHIGELEQKVDQLHQTVERLSLQISELTNPQPSKLRNSTLSNHGNLGKNASNRKLPVEGMVTLNGLEYGSYAGMKNSHKDILLDDDDMDMRSQSTAEHQLAPETQIRRLTAQLTAAYNRIADLEEQLLACRISS